MLRRICLPVLMATLALLSGCQSASVGGKAPGPPAGVSSSASKPRASLAVDFSHMKVIGYLGLASSAADITAIEILGPRLEQELIGQEYPFMLMRDEQVAAAAGRFGLAGLHQEMVDYWRDRKRVNKLKLQELCAALGIDALLVANIEEWAQIEPTVGSTQAAATRISVILEIYAAESGRRGWRERVSTTIEAELPASSTANTGRQDHGIARVTTAGVEPPRFEEVGDILAARAAETLAKAAGS